MLVGANHDLPQQGLIMIGQTISHHIILGKLGEGGMSVVYTSEDAKFHHLV